MNFGSPIVILRVLFGIVEQSINSRVCLELFGYFQHMFVGHIRADDHSLLLVARHRCFHHFAQYLPMFHQNCYHIRVCKVEMPIEKIVQRILMRLPTLPLLPIAFQDSIRVLSLLQQLDQVHQLKQLPLSRSFTIKFIYHLIL